ncbi:MAG: hypothetical protein ACLPHI_16875 [Terriglobales bacterium]|jgi:hypothetical protein
MAAVVTEAAEVVVASMEEVAVVATMVAVLMAAGLTAASDLMREAGKAAAIAVIQDQDRMPMEPKATAMAGTVLRAA